MGGRQRLRTLMKFIMQMIPKKNNETTAREMGRQIKARDKENYTDMLRDMSV